MGQRRRGFPSALPLLAAAATNPPALSAMESLGLARYPPLWEPQGWSSLTLPSLVSIPSHAFKGAVIPSQRVARHGRGARGWRVFTVVPQPVAQAEVEIARVQGVDPYVVLTEQAQEAESGSEGLFFLPYLSGERSPHFDPSAKGAWVGLTQRHGKPQLVRSILEGAAYAMKDCLELIREMGVEPSEIRVSGGGARSPLWRKIQAEVYGQDVCTLNSTEGPAFGAALLAHVGTGTFKTVPEACDATIKIIERTGRDPANQDLYSRSYPIYRELYIQLRETFERIDSLVRRRV